jgi:hypothetical protein
MDTMSRPALTSPLYLLALAILLLNDHLLKAAAPGLVTGKLSDFAGLFAFAAFWAVLLPRHAKAACIVTGALFVAWKSPWSEPLIALWNAHGPFPVARVVDPWDLTALLVLPLAYLASIQPPERMRRTAATAGVALVSLVAFAATSIPHELVLIPDQSPLQRVELQGTRDEMMNRFRGCGAQPYLNQMGLSLSFPVRQGSREEKLHLDANLEEKAGRITLRFWGANVIRPKGTIDQAAVLRQAEEKVRGCLGNPTQALSSDRR